MAPADFLKLIETCQIICAQLDGELSQSDLEILADDIDFFGVGLPFEILNIFADLILKSNIQLVAAAISKQLERSAESMLQIAHADTVVTHKQGGVSQLPIQASALQESITNQTTSIALTRARVTELGDQIHAAYRDLFEISIRLIEQTLHGSIARGTRAKAEHLAVVAKGMEMKLQILAQTDSILTDPSLQSELNAYKSRLEAMDQELSGRSATAEKALVEYERAGKGMSEIAKRYAQMMKECDGVRDEIQKLESRKSDVD